MQTIIIIVAIIHIWFFVFEVFLWKKLAAKFFKRPQAEVEANTVLALNQGFYNLFLGVGLLLTYLMTDPISAQQAQVFLLSCVGVAGIVGAVTANKAIFYFQALPALVAIALILK